MVVRPAADRWCPGHGLPERRRGTGAHAACRFGARDAAPAPRPAARRPGVGEPEVGRPHASASEGHAPPPSRPLASTPHAAPSAPRPAPVRLPVRVAQPAPPIGTALPITRAMLGALFDATLDAVIIMDEQGLVTAWNSQAERLSSAGPGRGGRPALATLIIPRRLRARHEAGMRRVVATGEGTRLDQRLELPALRRDGTEFPAELTDHGRARSGNRVAFAGFLRDLTRERERRARPVESGGRARRRATSERRSQQRSRRCAPARRPRRPRSTSRRRSSRSARSSSSPSTAMSSMVESPLAVRSPSGVPITVSRRSRRSAPATCGRARPAHGSTTGCRAPPTMTIGVPGSRPG